MRGSLPTGRFFWTSIAAVLFGSLFSGAIPSRAESPSGSAAERRTKAFEWFSTLGYPDVKDLKFVRVRTGETVFVGNKTQPKVVYGFLTNATKDSFTVFTTTTEISNFAKSPNETWAHRGKQFDADDLIQYANLKLKSLHSDERVTAQLDPSARDDNPISKATEAFVVSWACWREGHGKVAAELFDQAARWPRANDDWELSYTFQARLAANLSRAEMLWAIDGFSNLDTPRDQLLARFEKCVKNFPDSNEAAQARETVAALKLMVQEDRDHAARLAGGKPFEKLDKRDQIAELIFQLRDQVRNPVGEGAEARLEKLGYDAVPQLIAALDDKRFSRTVVLADEGAYVLTVGDCAADTLVQIAARDFHGDFSSVSDRANDAARLASIKKEVEAWYAEAKRKGEKQMLLEATEKGDDDCLAPAQRLAEKYPDAAVAAIATAIDNAPDAEVRQDLFSSVAAISGDRPIPFLLHALRKGKTLGVRVAAAMVLGGRNRDEGVPAMIGEWKNAEGDEQPDQLVDFLASCGKVEAIKALADGLEKRPVGFRFDVVYAFHGISAFRAAAANASTAKPPKEWNDAVVNLLVAALDDTEDNFSSWTSMSQTGQSCANARVCDAAGYALNQLDSKRFPFDVGGTWAQRDRSLALLKNALRKEHGLPPLPVPELRKTVRVPPEKLNPLLDRLEQAPALQSEHASATAAVSAVATISTEIEKLGAGALAGTLERSKSFSDADWPHRMAFDRLAGRLASTVVEIQFGEKSLKPDDSLKSKLEKFKGKPLDPSALADLLGSIATDLRPPAYGFKFFVSRAANEAGTTLRIDIIDKSRAIALGKRVNPGARQPGEERYFGIARFVDIGASHSDSGSGSGTLDVSAIQQILEGIPTASPSDKVDVGLQLIAD